MYRTTDTYVVWSLEPEARMCPSGCHARLHTIVSCASSILPTSLSCLQSGEKGKIIIMKMDDKVGEIFPSFILESPENNLQKQLTSDLSIEA